MSKSNRELLDVLKFELTFLEQGGYGRSVRTPWKATSIFEDSPTCLNFGDSKRSEPCAECALWELVPSARRGERVPCHNIPLDEAGHTVESLERRESQPDLEEALGKWLRSTIARLEEEEQQEQLPEAKRKTVLIVDDDEHTLIGLEALLENFNYDTTTAWSGRQALELANSRPFDVALVDEHLPDIGLVEILQQFEKLRIPAIVMRANASVLDEEEGRFPTQLYASVYKWAPLAVVEAIRKRLSHARSPVAA